MGQYYKIVNIDKEQYFRPSSFLKLMEWNWLGNDNINKLLTLLESDWKDDRVIIVGDYYTEEDDDYFGFKFEKEKGFYDVDDMGWEEVGATLGNDEEEITGYLINTTKKLYVDLSKTIDSDGWKVSPTILLACGNQRGGGDYYGPDEEIVGSWAGNKIRYSKEKPNDMELLVVGFKEIN